MIPSPREPFKTTWTNYTAYTLIRLHLCLVQITIEYIYCAKGDKSKEAIITEYYYFLCVYSTLLSLR